MKKVLILGLNGLFALTLLALPAQMANAASLCPAESFAHSVSSDFQATIRFVNTSPTKTFRIYWLGYSGERTLYKTLAPGKSYKQPTYLTNPWAVTNTNDDCKKIYYPDGQQRIVTLK